MCSCRTATSPGAFRLERSSHRSRHQAPMSGQPDLPAAVNNGASATYTRPSLVKALYTNQRTRLSAAKTKTNNKITSNSLCWVAGVNTVYAVYSVYTVQGRPLGPLGPGVSGAVSPPAGRPGASAPRVASCFRMLPGNFRMLHPKHPGRCNSLALVLSSG